MVAEVVQLSNSTHGHRYTTAEKEAAYQAWKVAAGRSLRKAAEIVGVPVSTLGTWSQRGEWGERARREDADEASAVRLSISSLVTSEVIKSLGTVVAIRDDETASHKDRLNAATWLAGVGGVAPVAKSDVSLRESARSIDPQLVHDLYTLSTEELAKRVHADLMPERYPSATTDPGPDR